jgi:hypothetical protein
MVVKKKKKLALRSLSSPDDESSGISCGLWILLIASGLSVGMVLFTLFRKYIDHYATKAKDDIYHINNYKDLIKRAESYTIKYKNMSFEHDYQSLLSISSLRGSSSSSISAAASSSRSMAQGIADIMAVYASRKDLIVGIAQNVDAKNLAVFSATATSVIHRDKVDVVVFVNTPMKSKTREILNKYHITTIEYSLIQTIDSKYRSYHPSSLRWILLHQYLQSKQQEYGRVLMIDVRDSFFQSNPFETVVPANRKSFFYAFAGVESKTIKECGWNGGWVRDCFGREMLDQIGGNGILCSGVSIGSIDAVLKYVELMHDILGAVSSPSTAAIIEPLRPKFPSCERNGVDQGVHNVLLHNKLVAHSEIIRQSDASALVMNMQANKAVFNEQDFVIKNSHGLNVSIVHQYDRFPNLQSHLMKLVSLSAILNINNYDDVA